ncbi:unnamed protein product [Dibothriocephalus latus]|uniref:Uncharacterized protein n=1 Tax=Dibothriocephalus latus TaxID=60516 RepID=A0A3P6TTT0_DIBLA|nr:unnamed protein product [Dibothriocephalus latus]
MLRSLIRRLVVCAEADKDAITRLTFRIFTRTAHQKSLMIGLMKTQRWMPVLVIALDSSENAKRQAFLGNRVVVAVDEKKPVAAFIHLVECTTMLTGPPPKTVDYRAWRPCHLSNIATLNQALLEFYEQNLPEHPFLSSLRKPSVAFETLTTNRDKVYCLSAFTSETAFARIEAAFRSVGGLASSFLVDNDTRKIIKCLMDTVLAHRVNNYPDLECLRALLVLSVSPLLETPRKPVASPATTSTETNAQINFLDGDPIDWYPAVLAGFTSPGLILGFFCMAVNRLDSLPSSVMGKRLAALMRGQTLVQALRGSTRQFDR